MLIMEVSIELGTLEIFSLFYRIIGSVEPFIKEKIGTFGLQFEILQILFCVLRQIINAIRAIIIIIMGVICRHTGKDSVWGP